MERKIHFMEDWVIFGGDLGRSWINFRDVWSKTKYFQGAEDFFRDLGRSLQYFKGAREHRPPWGPHKCWYFNISLSMINTASESLKARKLFIFLHLIFYGQLQFNA